MVTTRFAAVVFGASLLACAGSGIVMAAPYTPTNTLGCLSPVGPGDTAAALRIRFGGRARIERVAGAEGETISALVLFPTDSRRRIEVTFADRAMTRPSSVRVRSRGSIWSLAGLHIGDDVERANQANRAPFAISGFEWDYGGYAQGFGNGFLGRLPGGCTVTLRFKPNVARLETTLLGDRAIATDNRTLREARATISEMAIGWPRR